jgi:hypothetical protein
MRPLLETILSPAHQHGDAAAQAVVQPRTWPLTVTLE